MLRAVGLWSGGSLIIIYAQKPIDFNQKDLSRCFLLAWAASFL